MVGERGAWLFRVPRRAHEHSSARRVSVSGRPCVAPLALAPRSTRDRTNWARMHRLDERWIPKPRIVHPWPGQRFDVRTQGRSRVR
jgi:hypothetical protein